MKARDFLHLIAAACAMQFTACADDSSEPTAPDRCGELNAASLEGEWTITGEGERYDCDAARADGKLDLAVKPFNVDVALTPWEGLPSVASGDEADAFVERVRRAQVTLSADISRDVAFEGGGGADCDVSFSIREMLSNGKELIYHFKGWVQEVDQATGTFSGSGPGDCKLRGTFTLDRR
jgi:hypothetical protein